MAEGLEDREVFVEIQTIGNLLRVTAIDAATGIEAVLSAPRQSARGVVEKAALQKLRYVLEKAGHLKPEKDGNPKPPRGTLA